jgi:hypothetical protein
MPMGWLYSLPLSITSTTGSPTFSAVQAQLMERGTLAAQGACGSYLPQCTARFCPMDTSRLDGPCSQRHSWAHAVADLSSSSSQVCRGRRGKGQGSGSGQGQARGPRIPGNHGVFHAGKHQSSGSVCHCCDPRQEPLLLACV